MLGVLVKASTPVLVASLNIMFLISFFKIIVNIYILMFMNKLGLVIYENLMGLDLFCKI